LNVRCLPLLFKTISRTCGLAPFFLFSLLPLLTSCSVTKYLPAGKYLYRGSSAAITSPIGVNVTELNTEVQSVLNNNTNKKVPVLGYYKVYRYYKFQKKLLLIFLNFCEYHLSQHKEKLIYLDLFFFELL